MDDPIDTKIVVALIAAGVSFIGLLISKEQKTSEFRQAWINSLREELSRFLGQIDSLQKLILINITASDDDKNETSNRVLTESVKIREIQSKITLLINPKEEKHRELISLVEDSIATVKRRESNADNLQKLTRASQKVLKEEWDRVKRGERVYQITKWVVGAAAVTIFGYFVYQGLFG